MMRQARITAFLAIIFILSLPAGGQGGAQQAAKADNHKTPRAFEIIGDDRQPLYDNPGFAAFRAKQRGAKAPDKAGRARIAAEEPESGIVLYELPGGGRKAESLADLRRALTTSAFEEIPCYRSPSSKWMVPTDLVIVQFKPAAMPGEISSLLARAGAIAIRPHARRSQRFILQVVSPSRALALSESLSSSPLVAWAQVNWLREARPKFLPNDTLFTDQWYLRNVGQGGSMTNRDMYAEQAWDITRGTSAVMIAFLDDGFDLAHPDLSANVFSNAGEIADGLDNDGNGYTNDIHGWDFVDNDTNPAPSAVTDNHGTLSVGFACAAANNGTEGKEGIAGLANQCRFLPIRIYTRGMGVTDIRWADAIDYAASLADVISIGLYIAPSSVTLEALRSALVSGRSGKGCVICAALGNEGVLRRYSIDLAAAPEVLTVSGSSDYDRRSWFADYGPAVNLVCPAGGGHRYLNVWSTDRMGTNGYETSGNYYGAAGTSAACPLAAGAAALLISLHRDWTGLQVRQMLEAACDKIDAVANPYNARGWNDQVGYGRINAWAALYMPQPAWDPYEPDDATNGAAAIADGELQYRALQTAADVDWVTCVLSNRADIRFSVLGATNILLGLYSSAGTLIKTNEIGCLPFAILTYTNLATGRYYTCVSTPGSAAIPQYGLHFGILNLEDAYEPDISTGTAKTIAPRVMQYRTFFDAGDKDYATFTLTNSAAVEIWTMGEMDYSGDTVLRLLDNVGAQIASNDDRNTSETWFSYISTQLTAGKYYIEVTECTNAPLASYQLLLETAADDPYEPDNTSTQAAPIARGERQSRTIHPSNDVDWLRFSLTNEADVLILTDTPNPLMELLTKGVVMVLYRDTGALTVIATNMEGNNIYFSAIFQRALPPGDYYVELHGYRLTNSCPDYYVELETFPNRFTSQGIARMSNGFGLTWQGDPSFVYRIQYTNAPNTGGWPIAAEVEGRPGSNLWIDTAPATDRRFYRIISR